ncbi:hypothetical protein [Thiocystis violacea]|uniref:hypothetical protein n=1 Tax=Thiocystis violacea TaxID=13725 RepID=UPI001903FE92|nr:hypothetical protein [Thiocystis violacea]MBK1717222.1 hypothetical protein [Thiocystis violacea]
MSVAQRLGLGLARLTTIDAMVVVLLTLFAGAPGLGLALLLVLVRPGWVISNLTLALAFPFVAGPSGLLLAAFFALVGFGRTDPEGLGRGRATLARSATPGCSEEHRDVDENRAWRWTPGADLRSALTGNHPYLLNDLCEDPDPWNPLSIYITGDPEYLFSDPSPLDWDDSLSSNAEGSD